MAPNFLRLHYTKINVFFLHQKLKHKNLVGIIPQIQCKSIQKHDTNKVAKSN